MLNLDTARNFIKMRGTMLEKERFHCLLTDERGDLRVFPVERLQNSDGGFALYFKAGNPSSINHTVMALLCLQDLNLLTKATENEAAKFILSRQNCDGIFVDPYETLSMNLPLWMETGTFRFAVYYTLFSCLELLKIDATYYQNLEKPLQLISEWQKSNGSMPGYLHNSWLSAGVFLLSGNDKAADKALEFLASIQSYNWVGSQLIWALETLVDAGLSREHPLLRRWLNWMRGMQNPNGSFSSEDGEQYNTDVTLNAIRVVKKYSLLTSLTEF